MVAVAYFADLRADAHVRHQPVEGREVRIETRDRSAAGEGALPSPPTSWGNHTMEPQSIGMGYKWEGYTVTIGVASVHLSASAEII